MGQGVFADGNQEADAQIRAVDGTSKLSRKCARALLFGAVEEILFELVEDDQQVAPHSLCPGPQDVDQGPQGGAQP